MWKTVSLFVCSFINTVQISEEGLHTSYEYKVFLSTHTRMVAEIICDCVDETPVEGDGGFIVMVGAAI